MKFKKDWFDGVSGYEVLKDGEAIGFVRKVVTFDLTTMWKNNESDRMFCTRKEAGEDLIERAENKGM